MSEETKEPQSYGSEAEWVKVETRQQVNDSSESPGAEHADFYASRTTGEETAPERGGYTTEQGAGESVAHFAVSNRADPVTVPGVTGAASGAKRDGFFKKRDY